MVSDTFLQALDRYMWALDHNKGREWAMSFGQEAFQPYPSTEVQENLVYYLNFCADKLAHADGLFAVVDLFTVLMDPIAQGLGRNAWDLYTHPIIVKASLTALLRCLNREGKPSRAGSSHMTWLGMKAILQRAGIKLEEKRKRKKTVQVMEKRGWFIKTEQLVEKVLVEEYMHEKTKEELITEIAEHVAAL